MLSMSLCIGHIIFMCLVKNSPMPNFYRLFNVGLRNKSGSGNVDNFNGFGLKRNKLEILTFPYCFIRGGSFRAKLAERLFCLISI